MKNKKRSWGLILLVFGFIALNIFIFVDIPNMSEKSARTLLISIITIFVVALILLIAAKCSKINYDHTKIKNKKVFEILYVVPDFKNTFPREGSGNIVIGTEDSSPVVVNFNSNKKYWEGDTPGKGQSWKKEGKKFVQVKE